MGWDSTWDWRLGICVVDGDEVERTLKAAGAHPDSSLSGSEAVAIAVRALQAHGFNVILSATASDVPALRRLWAATWASSGIDASRLLLHAKPPCRSGDASQVVRLSEEYRCTFISNERFLSQEGPWLGPRLKSWLKETKGQLQIQYAFDEEGRVFLPRLSGLVCRHIAERPLGPRTRTSSDGSAACEPAAGAQKAAQKVPDGPGDVDMETWEVRANKGWRELDPEAATALEAARAAGEAIARFCARGFSYELDLSARVQRNVETGRCREVRPRQWEPPAPAPAPRQPAPGHRAAAAASSSSSSSSPAGLAAPDPGEDLPSGLEGAGGLQACVVAVRRGALSELLLCVACQDPDADLLRKAGLLFAEVLCTGGKSLQEDDGGDDELASAISARGEPWNFGRRIMTYTVRAGRHAGLRAVGVGSNRAKRRRAAHLALAATAALHALPVGGGPPHLRAELQGLARVAEAAEQARKDLWRRCSR